MRRRYCVILVALVVIAVASTSTAERVWGASHTAAQPTVFTKITKSTQDLWHKTKDALTPGSKSAKKPHGHSHKSPSMTERLKSWLPKKTKAKEPPMTPSEWIGQKPVGW